MWLKPQFIANCPDNWFATKTKSVQNVKNDIYRFTGGDGLGPPIHSVLNERDYFYHLGEIF